MTSFGWKRKSGQQVSKEASSSFSQDAKDDGEEVKNGDVDWLTLVPNRKIIRLEDKTGKSQRLKKEGTILAESERFWEAVKKWDEAITYTPSDATLYEMKAQALMSLNELFPALAAATKVIEMNPQWWVGYQTLGRAQLNLGEVKLAVVNFSKAVHLNPGEEELWEEDLRWSVELLNRKLQTEKQLEEEKNKNKLTITEITDLDEIYNQENEPPSCGGQSSTSSLVSVEPRREQCIEHTLVDRSRSSVKKIPKDYVQMRDR
ncbi:hypothetical protein SNE40_004530 [Patella caerulea]|uniref:Tetratricopeptide repeat protein 33 n=1 Tax=Patella caerulea TaxID=87958 RepID=A0AAN8K370_PATCE